MPTEPSRRKGPLHEPNPDMPVPAFYGGSQPMSDISAASGENVELDLPPMKVVHVLDACRCPRCGAVCPSCLVTDEKRGS